MTIEKQEIDIDLYEITEDGSVFIEREDPYLVLYFDDQEIDLLQPYHIEGLHISQGESKIILGNEAQMAYFQDTVKVIVKEKTNGQTTANQ